MFRRAGTIYHQRRSRMYLYLFSTKIEFVSHSSNWHTLTTTTNKHNEYKKKWFSSSQRWNLQIIIAPNCKDQAKKISFLLSRLIYETNFVLPPCVCVFVVYQMRLNAFKRQNGKLKQSKSSSANFYKQDRWTAPIGRTWKWNRSENNHKFQTVIQTHTHCTYTIPK